MSRAYEVRIDSHGHLDLPDAVRIRHGFRNGTTVRVEDREAEVVVTPLTSRDIRSVDRMKAAIAASLGMLGNSAADFNSYLAEKQLDREREDRDLRSR